MGRFSLLAAKGLRASIYVVGGAAIALTLNNRRITRDIDAAFRDHPQEFRAAAAIVGQRHGLAPNWINSDAIGFTSNRPIGEEDEFEVPGLQVISASPEHLLAMKVRASMSRDEDDDDIILLCRHLGLRTPEEVVTVVTAQFDDTDLFVYTDDEYLYQIRDTFAYARASGQAIDDDPADEATPEAAAPIVASDNFDYPPILPGHSGPAQYTRAYTRKDGTHVSGSTRSPGQNRGR